MDGFLLSFLVRTQGSIRLKIFSLQNKKVSATIKKIIDKNLSYLGINELLDLTQICINNERNNIEGIIVEAGCALGGSAIALAIGKRKNRNLFLYDIFDMIPPPSDSDGEDVQKRYKVIVSEKSPGIRGNTYYGYEKNLYDKVVQSFADFGLEIKKNNIHLVKGLFENTLKIESPVALAHIDCDWYDSVFTCLNRIEPQLVRGGTLVIDDYYLWSGCKKAVDDYFESKDRNNYRFIRKRIYYKNLHIIRR